jgi:hypothetical protein
MIIAHSTLSLTSPCRKEEKVKSHYKIQVIIRNLRHSNPDIRLKAMQDLHSLELDELLIDQAKSLVETAGKTFPNPVEDWDDPSFVILTFLQRYHLPGLVKNIEQFYSGMSARAKSLALDMLLKYNTEQSKVVASNLLHEHMHDLAFLPTEHLLDNPTYKHMLFPLVWSYLTDERFYDDILHIIWTYTKEEWVKSEDLIPQQTLLLNQYTAIIQKLLPYQADFKSSFVWQSWKESYLHLRSDARVFLDVFGYMGTDETKTELKKAICSYNDPLLKGVAIISALRLMQPVDENEIRYVAADHEARNLLYSELELLGKTDAFCSEFKTQEHFAVSNMIDWLKRSEDFAAVPEHIEVIKKYFPDEEQPDIYFYLMKFAQADREWLTGISGPYKVGEEPTVHTRFRGWSTFTFLDDLSEDEHADMLLDSLQEGLETSYLEPLAIFSPPFNTAAIILLVLIAQRILFNLDSLTILAIIISILIAIPATYSLYGSSRTKKKASVTLCKGGIQYEFSTGQVEFVHLHDIKKISIKKLKWRKNEYKGSLWFRTKYIVFHDEAHRELMRIPKSFVERELFNDYIKTTLGSEYQIK